MGFACTDCGRDLPPSSFYVDRRLKRGHRACCKECCYRRADPARKRAYNRRYSQENMAKIVTRMRDYTAENADHVRTYQREYQRKWREANRGKVNEIAARSRRRTDKALIAFYARERRARRVSATITPFTKAELVQRLTMFSGCWICGGVPDAVDHVKPLAAGGAHCLSNLRPICTPCNSRKGSRWPYLADQVA